MLNKYRENADKEFAIVHFNSTGKEVLNSEYNLAKSFQEVFNRINNWINERSCWMTESVNAEYVNSFIYSPLSASSYVKLPDKLRT